MIKPLTPGRRLPFRPVGRQCRAPVHVRRRERWNAGSVKTVMRSVGPGEAIQSIQTRVSLCKEIDSGRLEIRPLRGEDVQDSAALLTRVFMNVKESISGRDAKQLCEKALMSPPRALMLVAQLTPNNSVELGPERKYRLVGLTHISFSPDTRPLFQTAQPPDTAAYISSMAVDAKYRRQGIARLLIEACEELCVSMHVQNLTLHAWSDDEVAQKCYHASAFHFAKRSPSSLFPVWRPPRSRLLMEKQLEIS